METTLSSNPNEIRNQTQQIHQNNLWVNKALIVIIFSFLAISQGCKKDATLNNSTAINPDASALRFSNGNHSDAVNLVSDTTGFGAIRVDSNLNNAWGIAFGPTGGIWIASNHKGRSVIYDANGNQLRPPVAIPFHGALFGGAPSGVVYNNTTSFVISSTNQTSKFIFSAEDGTISAWASGDSTIPVVDRSAMNSVYKGLAIANDGGSDFIYATDFHNAKVDVFDSHFNLVSSKPFTDPGIPAGFAPFNIKNVDGKLIITYALQKGPDNMDDQKGPGNGYVDIYNANGTLITRFASQGALNSPWGIAVADKGEHHDFKHHDDDKGHDKGDRHDNNEPDKDDVVLIGNFGDGHVSIYSFDGTFKGQLMDNGTPLAIDGLWAISFPQLGGSQADEGRLYFTAGPDDENHGIFGYINKR